MDGFSSYQSGMDISQLQRYSQSIGSNVQKISQNVKSIKQLVNQLGTEQDKKDLRNQLHHLQHYTGGLAKDTNAELSNFKNASIPVGEDPRAWKMQVERLTRDFTQALNDFQSTQREAINKEKAALQKAKSDTDAHFFDERGVVLDLGSKPDRNQMQLQIEQEAELEAFQQQESQIRQLESDIMDVNQIFKDLATMVHEQGEVIDSIEANVESAQIHVSQGRDQLSSAMHHQNKSRKRKICLVSVGVISLIILIIIIVYSSKS